MATDPATLDHLPDDNGLPPGGPAVRSIRAALADLVPSELRVAQVVLEDPRRVMYQSVSEVAAAAGTSASTVIRACRRLGYTGFQDLKLALAQDAGSPIQRLSHSLDETSDADQVLGTVLMDGESAVQEARRTLDTAAFGRAVEALTTAGRVLLAAVGTSAPLAQDAAYRFLTIGLQAEAPADVHVQHVRAGLLGPGDVCIAISHTGATRETIAVVEEAAAAGALTIGVSSFLRSPITDLVDIALVAGSSELSFRIEAMASRIAHLCTLDALLVGVALRRPERATAAQSVQARVLSTHRL